MIRVEINDQPECERERSRAEQITPLKWRNDNSLAMHNKENNDNEQQPSYHQQRLQSQQKQQQQRRQ